MLGIFITRVPLATAHIRLYLDQLSLFCSARTFYSFCFGWDQHLFLFYHFQPHKSQHFSKTGSSLLTESALCSSGHWLHRNRWVDMIDIDIYVISIYLHLCGLPDCYLLQHQVHSAIVSPQWCPAPRPAVWRNRGNKPQTEEEEGTHSGDCGPQES